MTKGGFRGGRTGRAPPLKFFQIRFFLLQFYINKGHRILYLKAYLKYIIFEICAIKKIRPSPPFFQSISICATPNFKSWIRQSSCRRHFQIYSWLRNISLPLANFSAIFGNFSPCSRLSGGRTITMPKSIYFILPHINSAHGWEV